MSADTPLPVFAEIFQISGRKNCKETIFALENKFSDAKIAPSPTYTPSWTISKAALCAALGVDKPIFLIWGSYMFFDSMLVLFGNLVGP